MPLMQGFPPAPEDRATLANWRTQPFNAWAFHHVREVVPSAEIRNDPANVRVLEQGDTDLSAANLDQAIDGMANDALVILHKGRVVHESYRNGPPRSAHSDVGVEVHAGSGHGHIGRTRRGCGG